MNIGDQKTRLFHIKGIHDGLLVTLGDGSWDELQLALFHKIDSQAAFFHGAKMTLDVGEQRLKAVDLGTLRDKLSDRGVSLWAVLSTSEVTEKTAQLLGLATKLPSARAERKTEPVEIPPSGDEAIFLKRTLRSGVRVSSQGNVIVLGEVNPGAEIEAGGNVLVWGKLSGSVHAGANGNEECSILAMELNSTQLRIAEKVYGQLPGRKKTGACIVRIHNGQIVIEPWGN